MTDSSHRPRPPFRGLLFPGTETIDPGMVCDELIVRTSYLERLVDQAVCVGFFADSPCPESGMKMVGALRAMTKVDVLRNMLDEITGDKPALGDLKAHLEQRNKVAHRRTASIEAFDLMVEPQRIRGTNNSLPDLHRVALADLENLFIGADREAVAAHEIISSAVAQLREPG